MRTTGMLGGGAAFALAAVAAASPFTLDLVVNEQVDLGDLTYEQPLQVVAGNGGVVVTNTMASGQQYVMLHASGSTTILASALDDGGWDEISELAVSPNGTVTYLAGIPASATGLYQVQISGGSPTRVEPIGVNLNVNSTALQDIHYQVNASGAVAYKYVDSGVQEFSTSTGATVLNTVVETSTLKNFNLQAGDITYRRQAVAGDGSVVFYAEDDQDTPGVYRMSSGGNVSNLNLSGLSSQSRVFGASDDAVLYSTVSSGTRTLNIRIGGGTVVPLASYDETPTGARVSNAVMTQQNRVAYFDPGSGTASVKYYDTTLGVTSIASEGGTVVDGAQDFTIAQLSMDDFRRSNPMVNDRGVVVFDAILNPGSGENLDTNTTVYALLLWDTATQQTKIVVKADGVGGAYSDDFEGGKVLAIGLDYITDQGGDVLKDGLSEDNWLAFAVAYIDGSDVEHIGVAMVQVPEPAGVAVLVFGAGALLRRRRSR